MYTKLLAPFNVRIMPLIGCRWRDTHPRSSSLLCVLQFYGEKSTVLAASWNMLGLALAKSGELVEAEAAFRSAIATLTPCLGPGVWLYLTR